MNTYTEKIEGQLINLLEKTQNTAHGFKMAANNVENLALKSYFKLKAQERHSFGDELELEIKHYHYPTKKLKSNMIRAWMDVCAIISFDDEESMLEETIKGEKAAIKEYDDILSNEKLPVSTKSIIISQKNKIKRGLSRFRTLEELF